MERKLGALNNILRANPAIVFQHVKRKSNRLVGSIANKGVTQNPTIHRSCWDDNIGPNDKEKWDRTTKQDYHTPDVGVQRNDDRWCSKDRSPREEWASVEADIATQSSLHA